MKIIQPQKNRFLLIITANVLWLLSSVIAFLLIIPTLESITRIYAAFWADPDPIGQAYFIGVSIRQAGVFILAFISLILIIGGAEHHSRNFNTPSSWRLMFLNYGILVTIYLFAVFF